MSKKITHKEHRQLLSELYKRQGGKWIYQADAYIKQQERDSKLLELYRELNNKILHTYDVFGRMTNKEWAKFCNLQQQIKEKEDETNR